MKAEAKQIQIVGGGLAGLSLGIALRRRGVPVCLHEAGTYPRHKVCGEFIAGLRNEIIATLGIESVLQDAERHRDVVWMKEGVVFRRDRLPQFAYGISRFRLDQRLVDQFQTLGGVLRTGSRIDKTRQYIVWTAGRNRSRTNWLGVKIHCRALQLESDLEVHLGEDAYAGASKVEDGRVNVCALVRRRPSRAVGGPEQAFFGILAAAGLEKLAARVAASDPDFSSRSSVAGLGFGRVQREDGCIRLGDAYALPPPFTGDGMAMAFEGAAEAVEPLLRFSRGEASWGETARAVRHRLDEVFRRRLGVAQSIHPFLYHRKGQALFRTGTRSRLLPFKQLFNLLH